ncbi:MAG: hypothetical protein ACK41E_09045 [Deinococcales bacterium]
MSFDFISFLIGAVIAVAFGWWLGGGSQARQLRGLQESKRKLEDERQKIAHKLEQAQQKAEAKDWQISTLEADFAALKSKLPKLEGFERANADLRLQLQGFDTIKQKLEAAERELAVFRPKVQEFDALAARLESIQQEFSQYKARTAGFEALSAKAARVSELEGKIALLEQQKATHLSELSQMSIKVSDAEYAQKKLRLSLDESLQEISHLRAGILAFKALESKVAQVDALGISPEAQARIGSLETELGAYQKRVEQLEERLKQIPELEAQLQRLQNEPRLQETPPPSEII